MPVRHAFTGVVDVIDGSVFVSGCVDVEEEYVDIVMFGRGHGYVADA